jgi:signal peptidase I
MGISSKIVNINLTEELVEKFKNDNRVVSVKYNLAEPSTAIFPHTQPDWSSDNMGPIYIPKAGVTVALNKETLPFYKMIITDYEKNKLEVNGDVIRINGKVARDYTFKQDYFWMMGDNRHNSEDSRYWGYVPADHIVGKPVFIWMSLDKNVPWGKAIDKIRWERMFTTVGGSGEPTSYFIYFVIILGGYFGYNFYRKRKKKANA